MPGHQAVLHSISTKGADAFPGPEAVLPVLKDIMDEHRLIKLVIAVPGHARKLYEAVKRSKFELEGWHNLGCMIDGQPTDLAMLGIFRMDFDALLAGKTAPRSKRVPKKKKGKKRPSTQVAKTVSGEKQED
jgi:hypothetical protein